MVGKDKESTKKAKKRKEFDMTINKLIYMLRMQALHSPYSS